MSMTGEKSHKIFVTGTDTGVGKTVVTLAIALYLLEKGLDVRVIKPVETGCDPECEDVNLYKKYLGKERAGNYMLYRYPAAPWTAARVEGKTIKYDEIVNNLKNEKGEVVLIEGAGGLLVPITENKTYLHLITQLQIPVIVVAGNKLGVINHTLLTTWMLKDHNIEGIVILNDLEDADPFLLEDNLFTLKTFSPFPVAGRFPRVSRDFLKEELIRGIQPLASSLSQLIPGIGE